MRKCWYREWNILFLLDCISEAHSQLAEFLVWNFDTGFGTKQAEIVTNLWLVRLSSCYCRVSSFWTCYLLSDSVFGDCHSLWVLYTQDITLCVHAVTFPIPSPQPWLTQLQRHSRINFWISWRIMIPCESTFWAQRMFMFSLCLFGSILSSPPQCSLVKCNCIVV